MAGREQPPTERPSIDAMLGYLNFSSGAPDCQFLAHLNDLCAQFAGTPPAWRGAVRALEAAMPRLASVSATFADISQAQAVVRLLGELLPAYRAFHADLLFHQSEETLFGAFFVGRACEAILQQGAPWEETQRVVSGALARLNDYVGYRPVATLESRRHEAYPHEWLRPVPLYIQGAGVESGRYAAVVARALDILRATDEAILRAAHFDPDLLTELAFDPRAYDFDHPVNKRPNYHFGQWDPHQIDQAGRYRRFVVQQVTLEALWARVEEAADLPQDELLFEAAAVLAGTILMASGISGSGPGVFDSTVTLATLLPTVAAYRDAFYERLLAQATAAHRRRLAREAEQRHQPFGAARQHLNAWLARRRARQLEHVHLAKIFARMGHAEAATRQVQVVPVASARLQCEMDCRLAAGDQAVQRGALAEALSVAGDVVTLLQRAIDCGAVIDPWNLLGFDAHFSLFPALENSVHDHRADDLVALMDNLFGLYARTWSAAAAENAQEICQQVREQFERTASWWRQFAAHEVSSVDAVDAHEVFRAAEHVAESLNLWHQGGAGAGDLRFWAPYAHRFNSPNAFALVVQALLERDDFVASMSLLVHWLSQADHVPLEQGTSSFDALAQQWLLALLQRTREPAQELPPAAAPGDLVRKFFEFLEANADDYWEAPTFALAGPNATADQPVADPDPADVAADADQDERDEDEDEDGGLYSAAYEGVVYTDSADDGIDGELFDIGDATTDELSRESRRIVDRVTFLSSLAKLWKLAAVHNALAAGHAPPASGGLATDAETVQHWIRQTVANHRQLLTLLDQVRRHRIPLAGPDPEALAQYDRQRVVKDALLERIAASCVDVADAGHMMLAAYAARGEGSDPNIGRLGEHFGEESDALVRVLAAVLQGDPQAVRDQWPALLASLAGQSLLYVPLSKDGAAGRESQTRQYVAARCRQVQLQHLLAWLPRRGLWLETCQLIETARRMERNNPVGPGAVTEFDELFKTGYRALVDSLVTSAESWEPTPGLAPEKNLVATLESLTEVLLGSWLQHSRTLRLSVLERIASARSWERLVKFIERYGADVFTQRFLSLGNVRGILHQGVGNWLACVEREAGPDPPWRLLQELDSRLSRQEAVDILSLILEAVLENYGEYRDYNSTTTQSDRGDLLYMFLDFLRLRTEYDRVCWHLKPVILAHEILVTRRQEKAARRWRRALTERIGQEAEHYLERLRALQDTYAMRMSTVADRIAERFARPMIIDRMRAMVRPAMAEAQRPGATPVLELLEYETQRLAGESTGLGFDLPVWLLALEEEVDRAREPAHRRRVEHELASVMPCVALSRDEIQRQLAACTREPV
jgi:hypothetical protein